MFHILKNVLSAYTVQCLKVTQCVSITWRRSELYLMVLLHIESTLTTTGVCMRGRSHTLALDLWVTTHNNPYTAFLSSQFVAESCQGFILYLVLSELQDNEFISWVPDESNLGVYYIICKGLNAWNWQRNKTQRGWNGKFLRAHAIRACDCARNLLCESIRTFIVVLFWKLRHIKCFSEQIAPGIAP